MAFKYAIWIFLTTLMVSGIELGMIKPFLRTAQLSGLIMFFSFFAVFSIKKLKIQTEVILLFMFTAWSLTGIFVSVNREHYINALQIVVFNALMGFAISGIVNYTKRIQLIGIPLIVSGLAVSLMTLSNFSGYSFKQFIDPGNMNRITSTGLHSNPNAVAGLCLLGFMGSLYYWKNEFKYRNFSRIVIGILITFFTSIIIATASRKNIVGCFFFLTLYLSFCYKNEIKKNRIYVILIVSILFGSFFAWNFLMKNTYLGYRMQEFETVSDLTEHHRFAFYYEAIDILIENPIVGVGLDNFRFHSYRGKYSHSDYIEVITGTGLIGFTLYIAIFILLIYRLTILRRKTCNPAIIYNTGFAIAAILTILLEGFGHYNYINPSAIFVVFSFVGYSAAIDRHYVFFKRKKLAFQQSNPNFF